MELVVVNGANNIAKSVIRSLTASGQYSKVRLLDFHAHRQSVYALQRELSAKGIEVDKRLTKNAQSLELGMEGADKVVYFTHDYFSMVSCKNNFLVASSKIAKRQGIQQMLAVCPVEHDMAYSEDQKSWIEKRAEAQ